MYIDSNYDHDKIDLVKAIEEHDFEKAEREYRFIQSAGVNVLVPYSGEKELFDKLAEEARTKGISKSWMRRAAPITVTSYREEKLKDIAEACIMMTRYGSETVPGWYILSGKDFYDNDVGLRFDDESSLDYLI